MMSKAEKLSHYGIVVLALCAVVVSIWQAQLSQRHNRLSVRPFLDYFHGWEDVDEWTLTLSNHGIGPAVITEVDYRFGGESYKTWDDVLDAMEVRSQRIGSHTFSELSYMPANRTLTFLELRRPEDNSSLGLTVQVHYESIYEEPFTLEIKL